MVKWIVWGYSLTWSNTATNQFLGNLDKCWLKGVLAQQRGDIPEILFALFEGMVAAVPSALVAGAIAERERIMPLLVFTWVWTTVVYDPVASWVWKDTGWANRRGLLDFAGGIPIQVCAGSTVLAYTTFTRRFSRRRRRLPNLQPLPVSPFQETLLTEAAQCHLRCSRNRIDLAWILWS